jgi:hypothetical protein
MNVKSWPKYSAILGSKFEVLLPVFFRFVAGVRASSLYPLPLEIGNLPRSYVTFWGMNPI